VKKSIHPDGIFDRDSSPAHVQSRGKPDALRSARVARDRPAGATHPTPLELSRMGLSILRLHARTKRPYGRTWNQFMTRGTTSEQVEGWMNDGRAYNWGVVLGKASGIFALDVDSIDALHWVEARGGFGPNPVCYTSGRSPGQWLYRLPPGLDSFTRFVPSAGVEIRGNRHQSAIPPSIHPDTGKPYTWRQAPRSMADIPAAPTWLVGLIREHVAPTTARRSPSKVRKPTKPVQPAPTPPDPLPPTPTTTSPKILATTNRALLSSHALQFIAGGVFSGPKDGRPGCRNTACYLYALLLKGGGVRKDTALARILAWSKRQSPAYGRESDENPRAIVDAVWKRPYRPDSPRLLSLVTDTGNRLSENQARQVVRFYPEYRNEGDWIKRPALDAALRVLDVLIRRKITKPTAISLTELATAAGISVRRVEKISGYLDELGVRVGIERVGRSRTSVFDLTPLSQSLKSPRSAWARAPHVCLGFGAWRGYVGGEGRVLRWLLRRIGRLLARVMDRAIAILERISETWWCETESESPTRQLPPPSRGPPTDSRKSTALSGRLRGDFVGRPQAALGGGPVA